MRCSHCGQENPGNYKFCGMCGARLASAPPLDAEPHEPVPEHVPAGATLGSANAGDAGRETSSTSENLRAADEFLRRRPVSVPPSPAPPVSSRASANTRGDEDEYEEPSEPVGAIHGPSFLGLSGSDDNPGGYLLEDEGGSHAGLWVVLLLLAIGGGLVAWKWEPIKTYVWTQASLHAQQAKSAAAKPATDAVDPNAPSPQVNSAPAAAPQSDEPEMTAEAPSNAAASPATPPAAPNSAPAPAANANSQPADNTAKTSATSEPKTPDATATNSGEHAPAADKTTSDKGAAAATEDKSADDTTADGATDTTEAAEKPPAPRARKAAPPAKPAVDDGAALLAKAEAYLYGRSGSPRDCRQALVYLKAAADKQNPAALSHVGAMYATGECGVRIDRVQAYKWFSKAYELQPSNGYLEQNLTMLWRQMSPQERQAITRPASSRGE